MNPYKKIEKLENKVKKLETENDNLRWLVRDCENIQQECELKVALANKKQQEYEKAIVEINKQRREYTKLMNALKTATKNVSSTYKKAFNDIKEDLTI